MSSTNISKLQITMNVPKIVAFCEKNNIRKFSLFGSVLRDDFDIESDIDVLVEFEAHAKPGLFDLSRMNRELEEIMEQPVDLLTAGFISQYFRQQVQDEARVIYEKVT